MANKTKKTKGAAMGSKAKKTQKQRHTRGHATALPTFIEGACEFSDDPKGIDDAVWVVRAIKRELIGGAGPVGNVWQELRDHLDAVCQKKEGPRRIKGDWLLLFVGYVMSKLPEMQEFWKNSIYNGFWVEAGFDLDPKPSHGTLWNRFTELEQPEILTKITEIADRLIRNAMAHDPEIGRVTHFDATGFHSRSIPHHACTDPATCSYAEGNKTIEIATAKTVKKARWAENDDAPTLGIRHPDGQRVIERRKDAERGEFKQFVEIGGHRCGLYDAEAGVRAYTNPDGTNKEFWVGGYDIIAVDGKYGAKLHGVIGRADRQEFNLYFALMRRLHNTLGRWPDAVTGDSGLCINKIFRFNTRRGIASVFPFRKPHAGIETREHMRSERIDEHGVVRCEHCGGETEQESFQLVKSGAGERPIFVVRCTLQLEEECKKAQTVDPEKLLPATTQYDKRSLSNAWRLLLPVPRTNERYHALRNTHSNMEHVFHHQRQRYRTDGNDQTGKLKRFGMGAHVLRCEVARLLEWFRLSLRFGWIGGETRHGGKIELIVRRGAKALASMNASRIRRGLQIPYGRQAFRRGWAPTPDVPPPKPTPLKPLKT